MSARKLASAHHRRCHSLGRAKPCSHFVSQSLSCAAAQTAGCCVPTTAGGLRLGTHRLAPPGRGQLGCVQQPWWAAKQGGVSWQELSQVHCGACLRPRGACGGAVRQAQYENRGRFRVTRLTGLLASCMLSAMWGGGRRVCARPRHQAERTGCAPYCEEMARALGRSGARSSLLSASMCGACLLACMPWRHARHTPLELPGCRHAAAVAPLA